MPAVGLPIAAYPPSDRMARGRRRSNVDGPAARRVLPGLLLDIDAAPVRDRRDEPAMGGDHHRICTAGENCTRAQMDQPRSGSGADRVGIVAPGDATPLMPNLR